MTNTENTQWTPVNANVKIGSMVKVSLSDAPEFIAKVIDFKEDDFYGVTFTILPIGRGEMFVSEHRITAVQVG